MAEKRAKRKGTRRTHPAYAGRPRGQWYPELVGVVPGYPRTYEIWKARSDLMRQQVKLYNAEGITGRHGVPDGWARKKKLIQEIQEKSEADARAIVEELILTERFKPDCEEARIAMEAAIAIVQTKKHTPEGQETDLHPAAVRNSAIKTILEFTQRKPVAKSEVAVTKAEDFLLGLS